MTTGYDIAKTQIGVVEWAQGSNPQVEKYYTAGGSGTQPDNVPWCAAFVNWCEEEAGGQGTNKLNAQSYLNWGTPVDLADAEEGDVVIFKRGSQAWMGHVTYYVSHDAKIIQCLGGNQNDAVRISGYRNDSKLLGVRRPPARPKANPFAALLEMLAKLFGGKK